MRLLAAITIAASLLTPLMGLAGSIYQCRADGDWHSSCCCEGEAACGEPALVGDAMRECGCCNVVRFERRDPSPIVVSPTAEARRGAAAVACTAPFASPGSTTSAAQRGPLPVLSLPTPASVLLQHCVLRL